jgi:hypothetical protein
VTVAKKKAVSKRAPKRGRTTQKKSVGRKTKKSSKPARTVPRKTLKRLEDEVLESVVEAPF